MCFLVGSSELPAACESEHLRSRAEVVRGTRGIIEACERFAGHEAVFEIHDILFLQRAVPVLERDLIANFAQHCEREALSDLRRDSADLPFGAKGGELVAGGDLLRLSAERHRGGNNVCSKLELSEESVILHVLLVAGLRALVAGRDLLRLS